MGIFPLPQGFGGTIPMKEWVLPLAGVGAEEPHLHQPQPALLPGVGESSLPEGCHLAGAEEEGGPLLKSAPAGALQPSLWLPRNLPQALCHQVRSL